MNTKYLDKVVEYLVDDTVIDYVEDQVLYPFIISKRFLIPLTYVQEGSPFFTHFTNYCFSTYGLTDQEINYVWDHYKDIMNDKLIPKKINESVNRRNEYLDKIVQYIVDDSIIEINTVNNTYRGIIRLPFIHIGKQFSNLNRFLRNFFNFEGVYNYFYEYCEYNYGLKDDEIKYVWEQYKEILIKLSKKY